MKTLHSRRARASLAATAVGLLSLMSLSPAAAAPGSPLPDPLGERQQLSCSVSGAVQGLSIQGERAVVGDDSVSAPLAEAFGADRGSSFAKVSGQGLGEGQLARFQQKIDGRVVAGSSIANTVDAGGRLMESMGNVATGTTGDFPGAATLKKNAAKAEASARKSVGAKGKGVVSTVKDQVWFAPAVAGTAATGTVAEPAYRISVTTPRDAWVVTVSARDASTVLATATTHYELNRVVCDAKRAEAVYNADLQCGKGQKNAPSRVEGGSASSVADVNAVYDYFGDTNAFYRANTKVGDLTALVGADYSDGLGKAIRGSVRQCVSGDDCPFTNAFWSDEISAMVYGEGVTTDDITGHELTHGVTSKTNGLVYENEAGAINESMSDVFGELMDQGNGSSDDTSANKWKMGEGSALGAIRDMKTPTSHRQPDTYKGSYWVPTTTRPSQGNDYGGVHTNSGVGNKLAQLLVDGGTHNAQSVSGIGSGKAAQIYWTAQTLLPSNASYATLGKALKQSCSSNANNAVAGITSADCRQVDQAIAAVKIP